MTLDPIMQAFLDRMAAQDGPKIHDLPPPEARLRFAALMALAGPKDVAIGKVVNLACPGPAGAIPLRNYTPVAAPSEALPTLVFYHGGGFVIGSLDTHDGLCRMIANEAGVRVVAVDYHLAPEHKFPAAVEDAFAALEFVEANAAELGVDANRIAVGGDSSGGALAAVVTQRARDEAGPALAFQLLFFPVTQIGRETPSLGKFAKDAFLERATLEWFFAHYLPADADKSDPRISPLAAASHAKLPPAYLMTAECDLLRDEGLLYAQTLKAAGVAVEVSDHPGLVHDFIYFQTVLPQAEAALKHASQALKTALAAE